MIKTLQKRNLKLDVSDVKVESENSERYVTGIIPYNSLSEDIYISYAPECSREMISPTAFNKTIADGVAVYANYNHDDSCILGNTKSNTLTLTNTDNGLICKCMLPKSDIGDRTYETINRGDCRTMSFEYIPYQYEVKEGIAVVTSCKLTAVSFCVINPAYSETDSFVSMRSLFQKRNINLEKVQEAINNNKVDEKDTEQVESINNLKEILATINIKKEEKTAVAENPAVAQEQPKDIPTANTDNNENAEKLEKLEEIQKELEKEISESI